MRYNVLFLFAGYCLVLYAAIGCGGEGVTTFAKGEIRISQPMGGQIFGRDQIATILVTGGKLINGRYAVGSKVQILLYHYPDAGGGTTEVSQVASDIIVNVNGAFTVDVPMPTEEGWYEIGATSQGVDMVGWSGRFHVV